jgi:hypothetical protein
MKKTGPTKKQNKWNDPAYAYARCVASGRFHEAWSAYLAMPVGNKTDPILKHVASWNK